MVEFTQQEWDVFLYIQSFRVAFNASPSWDDIQAKGLDLQIVKDLVRRGYLRESTGALEIVQEMFCELLAQTA